MVIIALFLSRVQKSPTHANPVHIFSAPTMTNNFLLQSVLLTCADRPKAEICALVDDTLSSDGFLSSLCCKSVIKRLV